MSDDLTPASDLTTWNDFTPGMIYRLDSFAIDAKALANFHRAFGAAADGTPSPVFMTARLMRAVTDGYLAKAEGLGAGGVTHVDWPTPVSVGAMLTANMVCESKRELASRPGIGLAVLLYEIRDQNNECVIRWRANQFLKVVSPEASSKGAQSPTFTPDVAPDAPITLPARSIALGSHTFTRDEIIAFAGQYDPQLFHLDDAAAARGLFGALCASGWHTTAIWFRMLLDHERRSVAYSSFEAASDAQAAQPQPSGFRGVTWRRPVYVGDTITFAQVQPADGDGVTPPGRHFVGYNQAGTPVFEITAVYD